MIARGAHAPARAPAAPQERTAELKDERERHARELRKARQQTRDAVEQQLRTHTLLEGDTSAELLRARLGARIAAERNWVQKAGAFMNAQLHLSGPNSLEA